jgi:hypothetical protein
VQRAVAVPLPAVEGHAGGARPLAGLDAPAWPKAAPPFRAGILCHHSIPPRYAAPLGILHIKHNARAREDGSKARHASGPAHRRIGQREGNYGCAHFDTIYYKATTLSSYAVPLGLLRVEQNGARLNGNTRAFCHPPSAILIHMQSHHRRNRQASTNGGAPSSRAPRTHGREVPGVAVPGVARVERRP